MHGTHTLTTLLTALLVAGCASTSTSDAHVITTSSSTAAITTVSSPATDPTLSDPPTTTAPVRPGEEWIAFQTTDHGRYGVVLVRPDGTDQRFAFPAAPAGIQEHPDWSPDGNQMLFTVQPDDGTEDIWVGDVPTGAVHQLVDCVMPCHWADEPAWSPDGKRVAFQRGVDSGGGHLVSTLEILEVATGATSVILTAPPKAVYLAPRWSPDGTRLVVEVLQLPEDNIDAEPTGDGIGVLDLAHTDQGIRMLTDFAHMAQNPDWSWTTDRILYAAYSADGSTATDLYTIRPDGTDRQQITHLSPTGLAREATFVGDGTHIVFVWSKDVNSSRATVALIAGDGGEVQSATGETSLIGQHPRVRP